MSSKNYSLSLNSKYLIRLVLILCFIIQIQTLSFKYPTAFTINGGKIFLCKNQIRQGGVELDIILDFMRNGF